MVTCRATHPLRRCFANLELHLSRAEALTHSEKSQTAHLWRGCSPTSCYIWEAAAKCDYQDKSTFGESFVLQVGQKMGKWQDAASTLESCQASQMHVICLRKSLSSFTLMKPLPSLSKTAKACISFCWRTTSCFAAMSNPPRLVSVAEIILWKVKET